MENKKNFKKSDYSETWLQNGIIYQRISPHIVKVDLKTAKLLVADRINASGVSKADLPVLCFVNNAINLKRETNEYYRKPDSYIGIKAIAMILDNYTARIVAELVFIIKKPVVPISFFNTEEKAVKWLNTIKQSS